MDDKDNGEQQRARKAKRISLMTPGGGRNKGTAGHTLPVQATLQKRGGD
jgi:hypothetical protein